MDDKQPDRRPTTEPGLIEVSRAGASGIRRTAPADDIQAPAENRSRILARRISDPSLTHDGAIVAVSNRFDETDPLDLFDRLDDGARPLFAAADGDANAQADALSDVMFERLGLHVERTDHRALLLGHALSTGAADPLLLAVLGHEFARRAGFKSLVGRTGDDYWTLLIQDDSFLPIGYVSTPDQEAVTHLWPCCAHEVGYAMLQSIGERAPTEVARVAIGVRALLPLRPHAEREEDDA